MKKTESDNFITYELKRKNLSIRKTLTREMYNELKYLFKDNLEIFIEIELFKELEKLIAGVD